MAANRHKSYSAYLQCAPHTLTRRPHHPTGPLASGYGATRPPPTDNRAQPAAQPPCVKPGCPGKAAPRELTPRTAICTPARPPGHHTQRTLCRTLQGRRCTLPRGGRIVPGAAGSPREPAGGTNIDGPRQTRTCTRRKVNNYATTRRVTCGRQPIRAENRAPGPRPANQQRANCTGVCCNPHRPVARVTVVSLRARALMHRRPPLLATRHRHARTTPPSQRTALHGRSSLPSVHGSGRPAGMSLESRRCHPPAPRQPQKRPHTHYQQGENFSRRGRFCARGSAGAGGSPSPAPAALSVPTARRGSRSPRSGVSQRLWEWTCTIAHSPPAPAHINSRRRRCRCSRCVCAYSRTSTCAPAVSVRLGLWLGDGAVNVVATLWKLLGALDVNGRRNGVWH